MTGSGRKESPGLRRKRLVPCAGLIAVLALLFILLVPAAPLLANLGVKPFCIRGDLPRIQLVACPEPAAAIPALPPPVRGNQGPVPIIVDDDGSPDGVIALLYFFQHPNYDVRAVTISCGEAHPGVFARHTIQLLAGLGRAGIPVGAGRETPLEGMNAFPDPWRQLSDSFWGISLPPASAPAEAAPAARLIVETIYRSPQPVIVFASGNLTNLAEALRLEPGIKANIREVHIMGGSIHRPGNIHSDWPDIENETAEWNIWVDPAAAQEVFYSGLPLHIIPLDATDQVLWTETDAQAWASGASESGLAVDLLQWMLRSWPAEDIHTWDLTAAISASDPEFCPESPLALDVIVAPGPEQGRTVVTGGAPNAAVCLQPDAGSIRARAASVFGK